MIYHIIHDVSLNITRVIIILIIKKSCVVQNLQRTVIISSIAQGSHAIQRLIRSFGSEKIIVIHSPIENINDEQMKLNINRNLSTLRSIVDIDREIEISMYDFYNNVVMFGKLLAEFPGYRIVCDLTGGDRLVSISLLYAMLLSDNKNIIAVYVKRPEDSARDETDIIQIPTLPPITDRQRDFMEKLGTGSTIGEIAAALETGRSNAWNLANALQDAGLVIIGKGNESVKPSFPGNIYMKGEYVS